MPDPTPPFDLTQFLAERAVPAVTAGTATQAPLWGFAKGSASKLFLADPESRVVETSDELMSHSWLISTPAQDRVGDVVEPQGCLKYLERYAKSAPVFFNHQTENTFPIGKSTHPQTGELCLTVQPDGIRATCFFHGLTLESRQAYELVKTGFLKGASIGFRPIKAQLLPAPERPAGKDKVSFEFRGLRFEEWELLEWSVVGIPCNPEALDGLKSILSKGLAGDPVNDALRASLLATLPEAKAVTVTVPAEPPTAAPEPAPEPAAPAVKDAAPATRADLDAILALLQDQQLQISAQLQAQIEKLAKDYDAPAAPAVAVTVEPVPPEAAPEPEDEARGPVPLGVAVLRKLCRELDELYHYCECKLPVLEHAKVKAFVSEFHGELDGLMAKLKKFANRTYPDAFPKDAKELAPVAPTPAAPDWGPFFAAVGRLEGQLGAMDAQFYALTGRHLGG